MLEDDLKDSKARRREIYERLGEIERRMEVMPTKEEWEFIMSQAKVTASREKFWEDLKQTIAKRGIVGVLGVTVLYYWDKIVLLIKLKGG